MRGGQSRDATVARYALCRLDVRTVTTARLYSADRRDGCPVRTSRLNGPSRSTDRRDGRQKVGLYVRRDGPSRRSVNMAIAYRLNCTVDRRNCCSQV